MSNRPLISLGMPVYNCESTIAEAIASIVKQTFKDWELIIIDDGSRDNTVEVARRFSDPRIKLSVGGSNKQLPARLNESVRLARGDYFARMDGDDLSYPDRLQKQLDYLEAHPEVDLLGGSILVFGADGRATGLRKARQTHGEVCGPPWRASLLPHVTWMGKKDWFLRNPYREDVSHAQDRELLTRTRRKAHFAGIPGTLVGVREPGLSLKKQLPARRQFIKTLGTEGIRQRDISLLIAGIPAELAKLAIDVFAIKTGLNYKLVKHRMPPVPPAMAIEWDQLLAETKKLAAHLCLPRVTA